MLTMQPSAWLYDFLKSKEQFRPTAYKPTRQDRWTIGYGHTQGVKQGDICSLALADTYLRIDVAWAVAAINRAVTTALTQPQFDALVSLVYNIGAPAFFASNILHALDEGFYAQAADDFLLYDHQNGVELDGLAARREQERARFLQAA